MRQNHHRCNNTQSPVNQNRQGDAYDAPVPTQPIVGGHGFRPEYPEDGLFAVEAPFPPARPVNGVQNVSTQQCHNGETDPTHQEALRNQCLEIAVLVGHLEKTQSAKPAQGLRSAPRSLPRRSSSRGSLPWPEKANLAQKNMYNGDGGHHPKDYKEAHSGVGNPVIVSDKNQGKKQLSNGLQRVHRLLTDEEVKQGKEARWMELEIHGRVRNLSSALWQIDKLTSLFLNGNHLQRVPQEICQLKNLTMLDLSHNKLRSLPAELGDMISLCHLYLNNNQLRVLPYELGKLFRIQTLGLQGNPLSPEIQKIYHDNSGQSKLLQFLLDHLAINTAPPPGRSWVMIRHADPERPIATFTVLCYNVLCDKYATVNQYSYCPSWALNWEYRKQKIIMDVRNYEADIISLQEVETAQYRLYFEPELKALGYVGIFSPKSRAKTMGEEDRKFVDGLAIFWKAEKFEIDREYLIEFNSIVMTKANKSEPMMNRVMPRDNIALCAVLKIKEAVYASRKFGMPAADNVVGSPLVVCTAHIHWDPEFCDVKLVQTMMMASELSKVVGEVAEKFNITSQQTPLLICGDLNSLPDSGVFEYLSRGSVSRTHSDLKSFKDDSSLEQFSQSKDPNALQHGLRLESAVDTSTVPFTNYTLTFKGMIDYIFSTPQSLARLGTLGPFDGNWIAQNKIIGFPHPHVPSDHIPIMAQYAIIPTGHQQQRPSASSVFPR